MILKNGENDANVEEIANFSIWLLQVGEGKLCEPNKGYREINIPMEHLLYYGGNTIKTIVKGTHPNLMANYQNPEFLQTKAILAPTIDIVDEIND